MKRSRPGLLLVIGALVLLPAWLLGAESGLRFGLYCAERLSGGAVTVREARALHRPTRMPMCGRTPRSSPSSGWARSIWSVPTGAR